AAVQPAGTFPRPPFAGSSGRPRLTRVPCLLGTALVEESALIRKLLTPQCSGSLARTRQQISNLQVVGSNPTPSVDPNRSCKEPASARTFHARSTIPYWSRAD